MASQDRVRKAYGFLQEKANSQALFSADDLMSATGWSKSTVRTYISKQYKDVLERPSAGQFRVRPEFKRMKEEEFLQLATQKRQIFATYERIKYQQLATYEFLLPLTREGQLRKALDELFYEDTIRQRLSEIGLKQLDSWIAREAEESDEVYLERLCTSLSDKFGGYSITHVSGRFRAAPLMTRELAAKMLTSGDTYNIDETTASVRFMIPIASTKLTAVDDLDKIDVASAEISPEVAEEISLVHTLFFELFVEAIVRMVQGEDEIWLVEEAGPSRSLYVWERT